MSKPKKKQPIQLANLETFKDILKGLHQLKGIASDRELQTCIENIYSKRNIRKLILKELEEAPEVQERLYMAVKCIEEWVNTEEYDSKMIEKVKLNDFDIGAMVLDILTVTMQQPTAYFEMTKVLKAVSSCTPFGGVSPLIDGDNESKAYKRAIRFSASLLVIMAECDLLEIIPAKYSFTGKVMVANSFSFDGETAKAINRAKFLPPLICKPNKIRHNKESGYLTFNSHRITKQLQQHDGDICLDVINLVNSTPYKLNLELLEVAEDVFEPKTIEDYECEGKKPVDVETQKILFDELQQGTKEVCIELATLSDKFFFEWFVDYRGRMYSRGYHVNLQGNSYRKAMIDFAEPKPIEGWQAYADVFDFDLPEDIEFTQEELDEVHKEPKKKETSDPIVF